ncbi:hypothetical protein B2_15 [Stenotrophomonas phage B2]|nr:hypothetical protein B2_15 [Stenotrophomonas phage B2]
MTTVEEWCVRWSIPREAYYELLNIARAFPASPPSGASRSEAAVSSDLLLETGRRRDIVLFRNNVGALKDDRGVPVRYGLANESAAQNKVLKSADFIGGYRRLITLADVGSYILQFLSTEAKELGWVYTGRGREKAQLAWANYINAMGGLAFFYAGNGPAFQHLPEN